MAVVFAGAASALGLSRVLGRYRRGKNIDPLTRIGVYFNEGEADLARITLTAAGVKSLPRGGRLAPARLPQVGEWEIWVHDEDADRARAILGLP